KYGSRAEVFIEGTDAEGIVSVIDNGPGIPEDQQSAVFQPFYRIENSRSRETGGTGLGLSVVRDVITAHGGTITLNNQSEGGLLIYVRLPK
ncbi:MAG: two-component sensor histidine kinase, partial [Alphaproteobacteria bacterium]|nr:two-component sensor histidine kinase [Alphaproteobacteria bacterium]